jgi:hypothetical protein
VFETIVSPARSYERSIELMKKARSNDVHILQTMQLANIVKDLGIEGVAGVKQSVELFDQCSLVRPESEAGESGMEVDEDLVSILLTPVWGD